VIPHHCHAKGCDVRVPPKMLMCRTHWAMVPRALQRAIWREYVPGQERRKDASPSYLEVMARAIEAVDEVEHPTEQDDPARFSGIGGGS
jgi:hypothetical protein